MFWILSFICTSVLSFFISCWLYWDYLDSSVKLGPDIFSEASKSVQSAIYICPMIEELTYAFAPILYKVSDKNTYKDC